MFPGCVFLGCHRGGPGGCGELPSPRELRPGSPFTSLGAAGLDRADLHCCPSRRRATSSWSRVFANEFISPLANPPYSTVSLTDPKNKLLPELKELKAMSPLGEDGQVLPWGARTGCCADWGRLGLAWPLWKGSPAGGGSIRIFQCFS